MVDHKPEKVYTGEPDFDAVAQRAIDIGLGHVVSRVDLNILVTVALESMESDPVAVVRRGVESGTIKGEVLMWCVTHRCAYNDGAPGCDVWLAAREGGALHPKPCVINQFSEVLVIPVSDGGEDRP